LKKTIITIALFSLTVLLVSGANKPTFAQPGNSCSINSNGIVCSAQPEVGEIFSIRGTRSACSLMVFLDVTEDIDNRGTGDAEWTWRSSNPQVRCDGTVFFASYRVAGRL
jgi:hypothetical protein